MIKNDPIYHIQYERSGRPCEFAGPVIYTDIEKAYDAAELYSAAFYEPVRVYKNNELWAVIENYGEGTVSPTSPVRFTPFTF